MNNIMRDAQMVNNANRQIASSDGVQGIAKSNSTIPNANYALANKSMERNNKATSDMVNAFVKLGGEAAAQKVRDDTVKGVNMFNAGMSQAEAQKANGTTYEGFMAQEIVSDLNTMYIDEMAKMGENKKLSPAAYAEKMNTVYSEGMPQTDNKDISNLYVTKYADTSPRLIKEQAVQHQAYVTDKTINSLSKSLTTSVNMDGISDADKAASIMDYVNTAAPSLSSEQKGVAVINAAELEMHQGTGSLIYDTIRNTKFAESLSPATLQKMDKTKSSFDKALKVATKKAVKDGQYVTDVLDGDITKLSDGNRDKALQAYATTIKGSDKYQSLMAADNKAGAMALYDSELTKAYLLNRWVDGEGRERMNSVAGDIVATNENGQAMASDQARRGLQLYRKLGSANLANSSVSDDKSRQILQLASEMVDFGNVSESDALLRANTQITQAAPIATKEVTKIVNKPITKINRDKAFNRQLNTFDSTPFDFTTLRASKPVLQAWDNAYKSNLANGLTEFEAKENADLEFSKVTPIGTSLVKASLNELNKKAGVNYTSADWTRTFDTITNLPAVHDMLREQAGLQGEDLGNYNLSESMDIQYVNDAMTGKAVFMLTPVDVDFDWTHADEGWMTDAVNEISSWVMDDDHPVMNPITTTLDADSNWVVKKRNTSINVPVSSILPIMSTATGQVRKQRDISRQRFLYRQEEQAKGSILDKTSITFKKLINSFANANRAIKEKVKYNDTLDDDNLTSLISTSTTK